MKKNLTDSAIRALKPTADKQLDVWDSKRPGFGIRLSPNGTRTWQLFYRQNGRKHRLTLGRYPALSVADARRKADAFKGDIAKGENPAQERAEAKGAPTFAEFSIEYLERHAMVHKRAKSIIEDRRLLASADLAPWQNRKIADIKRRDVLLVLDSIVARGSSVMANRMRALLSKLFRFAVERGVLESSPTTVLPKREPEAGRERKLDDDELRRLWAALPAVPPKIAAVVKIALISGLRKSEVLGLRWDEIEFERGIITLPGTRTKNKAAHMLPITPMVAELLEALRNDSAFVFPGHRGTSLSYIDQYMATLRTTAALDDFHLHDLRRVCATRVADAGADRTVLRKILNHVDRDVTAVYDRHSYVAEMRAALMKWERRLQEIVTGAPAASKVVELRAR